MGLHKMLAILGLIFSCLVHWLNKRKVIDYQEVPLQLYEYSGTVEKVTTSDKLQSLFG